MKNIEIVEMIFLITYIFLQSLKKYMVESKIVKSVLYIYIIHLIFRFYIRSIKK